MWISLVVYDCLLSIDKRNPELLFLRKNYLNVKAYKIRSNIVIYLERSALLHQKSLFNTVLKQEIKIRF